MTIRLRLNRRSEIVWHPVLAQFIGKKLTVVREVKTKAGPAYRFQDKNGKESQVLKVYAIPIMK